MSSDDDSNGHSINDDLRMAGLHGDDEIDLEADRKELFGSAAEHIEVDGSAAGAVAGDGAISAVADDGATAAVAGSDTATASGKRKCPSTSKCWLDFEKIYKIINGKKVRTGAK
ncbi:unnamed protein product [Urochloa humidicola]